MEIRRACLSDVGHMAALYVKNHRETYRNLLPKEYFSRLTLSYAEAKWSEYLQHPDKVVWVACESDEFLGFAAGMSDTDLADTWYLDSLHITPNAQGKGIGTALIQTMKDYAGKKQYAHMSVCIVVGNELAGKLYQTLGATHHSYFDDDFCGVMSHSEKLIWKNICR